MIDFVVAPFGIIEGRSVEWHKHIAAFHMSRNFSRPLLSRMDSSVIPNSITPIVQFCDNRHHPVLVLTAIADKDIRVCALIRGKRIG